MKIQVLIYCKRIKKISRLDRKGIFHGLKETDFIFIISPTSFHFLLFGNSKGQEEGHKPQVAGQLAENEVTKATSREQTVRTEDSFCHPEFIQLIPTGDLGQVT